MHPAKKPMEGQNKGTMDSMDVGGTIRQPLVLYSLSRTDGLCLHPPGETTVITGVAEVAVVQEEATAMDLDSAAKPVNLEPAPEGEVLVDVRAKEVLVEAMEGAPLDSCSTIHLPS